MANTPVSMTKLKHMLQLLASGNSQKGTFISGYKFLYSSKFHIHVIFYTKKSNWLMNVQNSFDQKE